MKITRFDSAYPSVNRLLPLWQVDFDSALSLYVHTETLSLAGITNRYKTNLQALFRQFQAGNGGMDGVPIIKARVMTLLLAERFIWLTPEAISKQQLVQRFGPYYDFRNKRLPVWQLDYAEGRIFVDSASW